MVKRHKQGSDKMVDEEEGIIQLEGTAYERACAMCSTVLLLTAEA